MLPRVVEGQALVASPVEVLRFPNVEDAIVLHQPPPCLQGLLEGSLPAQEAVAHGGARAEAVRGVRPEGAGRVGGGDLRLPGEEALEHPPRLVLRGLVHQDVDIAAAWPDERLVEAVLVISGHDDDAALLRRRSVERVQQAREGDAASPIPTLVLGGSTLNKDGVDILEQQHGPPRSRPEQLREVVVVHVVVGEVHEADV
mmetsp:Transcript_7689/g.24424  ORF Transcript_7689/g.24424 Transcript_7689/m.24424 type:complete len:200 (+) Transcript_7689:707-1306(+)